MIEVDNLDVTFNNGTPLERKALQDISLKLDEGEFACVIGSNGAGKSTLLDAIAGEVRASRGSITVSERDVTALKTADRSKYVARVFQDPLGGSCGDMSVAENLALAVSRGRRRGFGPALSSSVLEKVTSRIEELEIDLEDRLDDPMGSLSGGQRQALSLVMATLAESDVLLLDEHTAALDPMNAEFVLKLTDEVWERFHPTILMVTHSMKQALEHGARTIMLHEGRVVLDVSGDEREALSVSDLVDKFRSAIGGDVSEDRLLTS